MAAGRPAMGVAGVDVGVEGGAELGGHLEVPAGVEAGDDADRVGDQVGVAHVGDLVGGQAAGVALGGDRVHLELEAHAQELDEDLVVDVIGVHPVERGHEVGQRADDAQRIAVGDHDAGVGIGREHEGQRAEVRRRLHHPAPRRAVRRAPLQGLQHVPVPVVDRRLVDAAAPDRVAGHVVETGELVARELVGEGEDALGREEAAVLVHGGERRHHLVHHRDLVVGPSAPGGVGVERLGGGRDGDGVDQLPQQRRAVGGVAVEQLVQQRGARAAEAGHDDRRGAPPRRAIAGSRVPQVDQPQPVLHQQLQLGPGPQSTGEVQLGLVVERGAQAVERFAEPVVADVVETGGRLRGGDEVVGLQRHHRSAVVTQAPPEGHQLVDPGSPRGRLPRHAGPPYRSGGSRSRLPSVDPTCRSVLFTQPKESPSS